MKRQHLLVICLCLSTLLSSNCATKEENAPGTDLPELSISGVTLLEGDAGQFFGFRVSASKRSERVITVDFKTEQATAGDGTDFAGASGTLEIPAGQQEGAIEVEILGDTLKEMDERFKVILSNPVNASILNGEGLGTIRNDDTFVFIPDDGYITSDSYLGYDLVWRDEFNGSALNTADWTHETGAGGWGNQELQYYTDRPDNAYLEDGRLVIEAKKESYSGSPYTSARLITQNKQLFQYGRVDIRAILPEGQGIWPALWMLGANISGVGWPACGEIDIMELIGHQPSTVHGTAHWGPQGQGYSNHIGGSYSLDGEKYSERYHVFSIVWEKDNIKWYVDENEFFRLSRANVNGNYPFNGEFFFIFNIAVGGQWPGYPDESTAFPQRMYVDYIRVFQEL